jgi:3-hydroxy-9,10-secoandrosta-1,3,5(10)-triene-9,17-dione monooxygenase reductase component
MRSFDALEFRRALGSFATGVTIVTARSPGGDVAGVTANSFSSVSLDPPLVLWSLAKSAWSLPVFASADFFAIHILSASQEPLSNRFASRGENKFAGLKIEEGLGGAPLLSGCTVRLQCRVVHQYEGGDHIIFVGEVLDLSTCDEVPLVYHSGRYALAATKTSKTILVNPVATDFSEDFSGYLLWRANFQFFAALRSESPMEGFSHDQFLVMVTLLYTGQRSREALAFKVLGSDTSSAEFDRAVMNLVARDLIRQRLDEGERVFYSLSAQGEAAARSLTNAAMRVEERLSKMMGAREFLVLRNLLKAFVIETGTEFPYPLNPTSDIR